MQHIIEQPLPHKFSIQIQLIELYLHFYIFTKKLTAVGKARLTLFLSSALERAREGI